MSDESSPYKCEGTARLKGHSTSISPRNQKNSIYAHDFDIMVRRDGDENDLVSSKRKNDSNKAVLNIVGVEIPD